MALACSSGGQAPPDRFAEPAPPEVDAEAIRLPFLVDDYFVPNGCFGDGDCGGGVIDINSRACKDRPATAQGICRRYTYTPLGADESGYKGHLGILFQDVGPKGEGGIGQIPGRKVEPGATRVVFWASVAEGSALVHFRAGGVNNWKSVTDPTQPHTDDFGLELSTTLTTRLQQLQIDLSSVTYDEVVSPFGWAIESDGSTEPIHLYIDDLRWE